MPAKAEEILGHKLGPAGQALAGRVLRRKGQGRKKISIL